MDVSRGGSIKIIAIIHDQIMVVGTQNSGVVKSSFTDVLLKIRYPIQCANADIQHNIPNDFLIATINDSVFIFGNKSLSGLENIIITNKARAMLAKFLCNAGIKITKTLKKDR